MPVDPIPIYSSNSKKKPGRGTVAMFTAVVTISYFLNDPDARQEWTSRDTIKKWAALVQALAQRKLHSNLFCHWGLGERKRSRVSGRNDTLNVMHPSDWVPTPVSVLEQRWAHEAPLSKQSLTPPQITRLKTVARQWKGDNPSDILLLMYTPAEIREITI